MDDRDTARMLAWARIGIGSVLFLMPNKAAQMWTGRREDAFPTNMMVRGLGARDVIIGAGLAAALESGRSPSSWLQASAAADAADALGTLSSVGELGKLRALGLFVLEAGAAVLGLSLAESLDD
jgi:hypothetical protein